MFGRNACPECGTTVSSKTAEGLCPKCLLAAALGRGEDFPTGPEYAPTLKSKSPLKPPSAQSLARSFPQLEILNTLGCGGMGAVYKVRQKKLDRIVALKIVRPDAADDAMFTDRFDREARVLARLSHRNIVSVYDFGDVDYIDEYGRPVGVLYYFLMEFVDGVNLRRIIQNGETTPTQALSIVMQICDALQYAHDKGVIHRDIKPENILLNSEGHLKIADFGLAKLGGDADTDVHLTGTRQILGTVQYMAPEQMAQSKTVDHRADIYSMGVVLYEMLTGELPAGVFEPPSKRSAVDGRLDDVVMRALASDPARRYQHASEVGCDISSISSFPQGERVAPDPVCMPGPSTLVEDGVAAIVGGFRGLFAPLENDEASFGTSNVTLMVEDVENDRLPNVCMVCGKDTRRRLSRDFSYTSEAAGVLIVILMIVFFPVGILCAVCLTKKVRAILPVCQKDRAHWSKVGWFAGLGWTVIPAGVFWGLWRGKFFGDGPNSPALLVSCILTAVATFVI